jgi:hypothetical protein
MLGSHRPNRPFGPTGRRPIHNSMPPVSDKIATKAAMIHLFWLKRKAMALTPARQPRRRAQHERRESVFEQLMARVWPGYEAAIKLELFGAYVRTKSFQLN